MNSWISDGKDVNQLAKAIVDQLGSDKLAAVYLVRRVGLKGGHARAKKLTKERRIAIAKAAADARWRGKYE